MTHGCELAMLWCNKLCAFFLDHPVVNYNAAVGFLTYCLHRRYATPKSDLQNIKFKNLKPNKRKTKIDNISLKPRFFQH